MNILLTNDDGFYAAGLAAIESALREFADVTVVSPLTEQSGVSQSITFLRPLLAQKMQRSDGNYGFAVDGTPADCVKLGISKLVDQRPDLVISGINGGLNAGINVLYSGTVGGAAEGAIFGIPSFAVSLEWDNQPNFQRAAEIAVPIIRKALERRDPRWQLFNLNVPTAALAGDYRVQVVPMQSERAGEQFLQRVDPKDRVYYWATNDSSPTAAEPITDAIALHQGDVTLTPLDYDLTRHHALGEMQSWQWD